MPRPQELLCKASCPSFPVVLTCRVGRSMKTCLSSRPGLMRALSKTSARFVDAKTMTWSVVPIPGRTEQTVSGLWSGGFQQNGFSPPPSPWQGKVKATRFLPNKVMRWGHLPNGFQSHAKSVKLLVLQPQHFPLAICGGRTAQRRPGDAGNIPARE